MWWKLGNQMSKTCEREARGLTAKKQWWLRAYSPRSVTHAWVCPGFPEKHEEVGSVQADPVKGKLNMWAGLDSQDLDMEESC